MLGRLLTKLYMLFVVIFGVSKILQLEEMETDNGSQPEVTPYLKRLLHLYDVLEQLPERVTEAGDFDSINYSLIISKFSTIKELINNLEKTTNKFREVVEKPNEVTTDIPGFLQISYMVDMSDILANFLINDGKYLNIKEVVALIKKHTGEVITLYTQMKELEELDEDFIDYFERITTPTCIEIIHFIERLHALGVKDV